TQRADDGNDPAQDRSGAAELRCRGDHHPGRRSRPGAPDSYVPHPRAAMTAVETPSAPAADGVRFRRTVLGTCCIPWTDDERFDEDRFRRSVATLHRRGLADLYIFGTAGEGHAVSDRWFTEITAAFVDETQRLEATPMVGVIALSTR